MGRFVARRLLVAIPTLLAISFVMYAILALAPIDPLAGFAADPRVPPEVRENIRRSLGLDEAWPYRYVKWLLAAVQGNFGISFVSRSSVSDLLWQRLPTTLAVVGVAYIVGVIIALPAGILSAARRNTVTDHVISLSAYVGFSVPTFFTGVLLIPVRLTGHGPRSRLAGRPDQAVDHAHRRPGTVRRRDPDAVYPRLDAGEPSARLRPHSARERSRRETRGAPPRPAEQPHPRGDACRSRCARGIRRRDRDSVIRRFRLA